MTVTQPASGGSLAANGGVVSWTADKMVAYYRVELSTSGTWSTPEYVFATSGGQLAIKDVAPGKYKMRLGGFSEVSGQWEYSSPIDVTVQ